MNNAVMQFQILLKQPEETSKFYSEVFGWKVNADNPMGYREINTGSGEGIQGGIWPAPPQSPNLVQLFISVDDVKAYAAKAESLGAKVLIPCTTLPDGGDERSARFSGNAFRNMATPSSEILNFIVPKSSSGSAQATKVPQRLLAASDWLGHLTAVGLVACAD